MLKKFNSLGTAISRNEAKMVVGGDGTYELMADLGDAGGDWGCLEFHAQCLPLAGFNNCCNGGSCIHLDSGYKCSFH